MTFDMSRDIQLSLGIADPDRDDNEFDHESIELDSYFVQWQWCTWDYASEFTWKQGREEMGREALREDVLRWNCAKPKGCRCPEAMLLNWDLV